MKRTILFVAVLGCGGGMSPPGSGDDEPTPDASTQATTCPNGQETKIKFTQADGCTNDGSVEFCIPDSDAQLRSRLTAINPEIACSTGGGRAMCNTQPGRLLCFYPTRSASACASGAMTAAAWADMCEIAGQPPITEIVPSFAE